jgi:hypothetical protein
LPKKGVEIRKKPAISRDFHEKMRPFWSVFERFHRLQPSGCASCAELRGPCPVLARTGRPRPKFLLLQAEKPKDAKSRPRIVSRGT